MCVQGPSLESLLEFGLSTLILISSHIGIDPALSDPALARRLRENRSLAMSRLDEVISKYAMMQDRSEEGERQKRRARLPQATSSHSTDPPKASLDSGEVWKGYTLQRNLGLPLHWPAGNRG